MSLRDPQDSQFGAEAAKDQDMVDEVEAEGGTEDDLPEEPRASPRAGSKAPPEGEGS